MSAAPSTVSSTVPTARPAPSTRVVRYVVVLAAPVAAVGLLLAVGALSASTEPGLPDPGAAVRVGIPLAQSVRDIAAMVTVGMLTVAAWCVGPTAGATRTRSQEGARRDALEGPRQRLVDLALLAAATWSAAGAALIVLTYADAAGVSLTEPGLVDQALFFAQNFELGRYLFASSAIAALVALGCTVAGRQGAVGLLVLLALAGLWPMALTGHAAGTLNHDDAVNLQAFHLLGTSVWLGGLAAIALARPWLGSQLVTVVRRYSTLAGWSFLVVGVSGTLGAALRLQQVAGLWSGYGAVLLVKVAALGLVGTLGWWHRARLIDQMEAGRPGRFLRVVALDVAVLAVAAGAGVALSRTEPPAAPGAERPLSAAESLLGKDLPPALDATGWFTRWDIDSLWLPVAVVMVVTYLVAVRRLARRGDHWSPLRTLTWVLGWSLLTWATSGAPGAYGEVLFSMHMVQHMTIAMAVPMFLVLSAPVTLAMRAIPRRRDGSDGGREWLLRLVHSLPAQLLGHPVVAAGLFVVSLVAFYYSSLFELSLQAHTAHQLMVVHFLASGYLFCNAIIGIDPGPERPVFPFRALLLMVTFGFHAFFSVSLMSSNRVLAESWFSSLQRDWGASLLEDQNLGASIGWALGDYPLAVMAVALVALWVGSDRRERRRFDRHEDRSGDAELTAYNDHLGRLSGRRGGVAEPAPDPLTTQPAATPPVPAREPDASPG